LKPYIEFPNLGLLFDLNADTFKVGSLSFAWNSILINIIYLLAFVAIIAIILMKCEKNGVVKDDFLNILLLGTFISGICAVMYYVIFPWNGKGQYIFSVIRLWELISISVIIAIFIFARLKKRSFLRYSDFILPYIMLGQAIGMLGSFNSADSFGNTTNLPWGMTGSNVIEFLTKLKSSNEFSGEPLSVLLHPIYLYEAIICIIGFGFLMLYRKHKKVDGEIFCLYFIILGLSRVLIEAVRLNGVLILDSPIKVAQVLSVIIVVFGFTLFADFRKNKRIKLFDNVNKVDKLDPIIEETPLSRLVSQMKEEENTNQDHKNKEE